MAIEAADVPQMKVDNLRGAIWIIASCILFTVMATLTKLLGERLPSLEIAFSRLVLGLVFLAPFVARLGTAGLTTRRLAPLLTRGVLGTLGLTCSFVALANLPLAEATALSFTKPLFQVLLAVVVLHEIVRARRWSATAIGFIGVLIMLRPGASSVHWAAFVGLAGSFFGAAVAILIRDLLRTERPLVLMLYHAVLGSLLLALPVAFVWVTPSWLELAGLVALAGVGTVSQFCMMRAYTYGEASALAPFDYARLPFAVGFGIVLFAEWPSPWSILGAAIIAASTLYIAHREAQLARLGRS